MSPDLIEQYTSGECHTFALASHLQHGGDFLVAFDSGQIHWELEDEMYFVVLHVYARHQTPDGEVIRDICGDRKNMDQSALKAEIEEMFYTCQRDIYLEEMQPNELLQYISDPEDVLAKALGCEPIEGPMEDEDRPLEQVYEADLAAASALDQIKEPPGSRPEPPPRTELYDTPDLEM